VILTLKPCGRGNWKPLRFEVSGRHLKPLNVAVGDLWTLSGVVFRICKVAS
jgi:hypothetical protein